MNKLVFEKDIQLFNNQCRIYIIIKLSTSQRWLFEEVVKPIPIPAILTKYDIIVILANVNQNYFSCIVFYFVINTVLNFVDKF